MAATYNQVLVFYRDTAGKEQTTFWTLQDQADAVPAALVNLATKCQAVSRANVFAVQYQTTHVFGGSPSALAYSSVTDRCHTIGRMGTTNVVPHYDLIAPKSSIFLADTVTLDLANSDVSALVAAMLATIGDASGHPLASILRGRRQKAGRNP